MRWSKYLAVATVMTLFWCAFGQAQSQPARTPPAASSASPVSTKGSAPSPLLKPVPETSTRKPDYFVMIDAGHGGADKGSALGSGVTEKQVTLAFARELRKELAERGITTRLLRESDVQLSLEKRAELANQQRPFLYVSIHAAVGPHGVRVYTPRVPKPSSPMGLFVSWESAQFPAVERSTAVARSVTGELRRKNIHVTGLSAALRPLTNITAPAIAIELAAPAADAATLLTQKIENPIATAVAMAISQSQGHPAAGGHQ